MAIPMRYDSSGIIPIGPFVKSTDGYSPLTGMTSDNMTITFMHIGATATGDWSTWAQTENQNITELVNGLYTLTLSSNPLSKHGRVRIECLASGSSGIPFVEEIQVLPTYVFDSLVSTVDYLLTDIQQLGGSSGEIATGMFDVNVQFISDVTITTDAGDNFDNFFFDNDAVSTVRISELEALLTTGDIMEANMVAMSSQALTTDAGANFANFYFNNDVVSTERISELPTTADLFTTGSEVEANMVQMASQALTTEAGANFNNFFDNNSVVSTERISELPTTADLFTTAKDVNIGRMAGEVVTTDAADNWDYFWFNNDVVSTERVGDLPTTADLFTTGSIVESNVVAISSQSLTAAAGANFSTYFDNGGVAATAQIGAQSTFGMLDTVDGMTVLQYMQYSQAYMIGDFKVTGAATNEVVYDDFGGTTFFEHTITTVARTWAS